MKLLYDWVAEFDIGYILNIAFEKMFFGIVCLGLGGIFLLAFLFVIGLFIQTNSLVKINVPLFVS